MTRNASRLVESSPDVMASTSEEGAPAPMSASTPPAYFETVSMTRNASSLVLSSRDVMALTSGETTLGRMSA